MSTGLTPITRKEQFMAKAVGEASTAPTPITREEIYLDEIARNGSGGGIGFTPTQEQLNAMNSGIDSAKVAQIETNASDIADIQATIGDINAVLEEVL